MLQYGILKSMVQQLAYGLASSEQAKRVADWRRDGVGETVELKGRQRPETEQAAVSSRLTIVAQVLVSFWILYYLPS